MTLDAALREAMLGLVPEIVAEVRAGLGRSSMIPIKSAPVAYRAILAAERRGELAVYRVGHGSFVDEGELWAWVKRFGKSLPPAEPEPRDEIGELLEASDGRRKQRGRRAA